MYEIKTEDVYEDFSCNKEMFDFSNYLTTSKYYDDSNNLIIGKMKVFFAKHIVLIISLIRTPFCQAYFNFLSVNENIVRFFAWYSKF